MKNHISRTSLIFLISSLMFSTATDAFAKGHCGGHRCSFRGGHQRVGHTSKSGGIYSHNTFSGPGWSLMAYSALSMPLSGYVVYDNDTLAGTVTINNLSVTIKPTDTLKPPNTFFYTDKELHFVEVFSKANDRLILTRANEKDKGLSRVIHDGKLTIYDDRYSFYPPVNIDEAHTKIRYDKGLAPLNSFVCTDPKRPLTKAVNKAYNLKLHPQDFTLPELLYYIDRLD